jgi:hypothetical protein
MDGITLKGKYHVVDLVEGKDTAEGTRGRVCGLVTKGWHPVDLCLLHVKSAARTAWI